MKKENNITKQEKQEITLKMKLAFYIIMLIIMLTLMPFIVMTLHDAIFYSFCF